MSINCSSKATFMVVEDSDEDFEALSRVFLKIGFDGHVQRCHNGQECLDTLRCINADLDDSSLMPSLILLDLNLPGMDGREALRAIKSDPALSSIPVSVLTTSNNARDVAACYAGGANAYVVKSLNYNDFVRSIGRLASVWLEGKAVAPPETR